MSHNISDTEGGRHCDDPRPTPADLCRTLAPQWPVLPLSARQIHRAPPFTARRRGRAWAPPRCPPLRLRPLLWRAPRPQLAAPARPVGDDGAMRVKRRTCGKCGLRRLVLRCFRQWSGLGMLGGSRGVLLEVDPGERRQVVVSRKYETSRRVRSEQSVGALARNRENAWVSSSEPCPPTGSRSSKSVSWSAWPRQSSPKPELRSAMPGGGELPLSSRLVDSGGRSWATLPPTSDGGSSRWPPHRSSGRGVQMGPKTARRASRWASSV